MQLLKIGGNELDNPHFLSALARVIKAFDEPVMIVHGGGKAIAEMQTRLGLQPTMVEGLRVTDLDSLAVAQMVLSGQTNKLIVSTLLAAGVEAFGLSGVDGGLMRCNKKRHPMVDLGFVGEIAEVRPQILHGLSAQGLTPVVSPISLGLDGQIYNVNADEAAGALAKALDAGMLTFVSNVPAVLDQAGQPIATLTAGQTESLIHDGIIHGGMVPKVRAALSVIDQGVPKARIVNLTGLANGGGTLFLA